MLLIMIARESRQSFVVSPQDPSVAGQPPLAGERGLLASLPRKSQAARFASMRFGLDFFLRLATHPF
jgi:hypothetical protein